MALQLSKKQELVSELKEHFGKDGIILFAEFKGLSVAEVSDLRGKLYDGTISYKVYKNTLIKHAIKEIDPDNAEMQKLFPLLKGPTAMAVTMDKPVEAAKLLVDYTKQNDKVSVKCGFFEGKFLDSTEIKQLAEIGSKEQLIGRLIMAMKSPMSRLVNALGSPQSNLVLTLKAVADKMGGAQ